MPFTKGGSKGDKGKSKGDKGAPSRYFRGKGSGLASVAGQETYTAAQWETWMQQVLGVKHKVLQQQSQPLHLRLCQANQEELKRHG